jgi:hypothetical protein
MKRLLTQNKKIEFNETSFFAQSLKALHFEVTLS